MARRKNEPQPEPPRVLSDAELEAARPDQLERAVAAQEAWVQRISDAPDPGVGLARADAEKARQKQLAELRRHGDELVRLRVAYELTDPETVRWNAWSERASRMVRRKSIEDAQTDESRAFHRRLHEALAAEAKERDARRKLADARERRTNRPDPRATTILAAVLADDSLWDAVQIRLRPDGNGHFVNEHLLEPREIGVLWTALRLLSERGSFEVVGIGSTARWPHHDPPLVPVEGLRDALAQLRRQRLLQLRVEGDTAHVTYGDAVREIAARWGIELSVTHAGEAAVQ